MTRKKSVCFLNILALFFCNTLGQVKRENVNIICNKVNKTGKQTFESYHQSFLISSSVVTCFVFENMTVNSFDVNIENVLFEDKTEVNSSKIEGLYIKGAKNMNFLPMGIKEKIPKLRVLAIYHSGLIHLDKYDMQQFGSDLEYARFSNTSLTALAEDVFMYNSNLIYINLENNPLKFIDPLLFENFKKMVNLEEIDINHSYCIAEYFVKVSPIERNITSFNWNAEKCDDFFKKARNLERTIGRLNVKNFKNNLNETYHSIKSEFTSRFEYEIRACLILNKTNEQYTNIHIIAILNIFISIVLIICIYFNIRKLGDLSNTN